jgi:phenylacetate-CoA ligase
MFSRIPELIDDHIVGKNIELRAKLASKIPPGLVPSIRRAKFRKLIQYVGEKSPFYRRRFKEAGIDPRGIGSPEEMGNFFTTSQDLRENPVEDFLCGRPENGFETTGTTATTSKKLWFGRREILDAGRDGALGFYNLGLRKEDRCVDGFDYSFWNAPFTLRAALDALGCFHVTAAKLPPAEFYERVKDYKFTAMFVEPSWLVLLSDIAKERGTWPLKFIFVGGENMSEQTRHYIENIWGAKVYLSYGQSEAFGQIGGECQAQRGYHLDDFNLYCEIINTEHDGFGELVYSTLSRTVMPLIRYKSADITAFIDEPCTCALKSTRRIAKIRGRLDEMVNCGMGNLSPWFFEQLVEHLEGITDDWQIGILRTGNKDTIEFRLEMSDGGSQDAIAAAVKARVRERIPDSWRNYELGLYEFGFRFSQPGTLRTGRKLKRLIDERMNAWE